MRLLDWFRPNESPDRPPEMSRRDFFSRIVGRAPDRPSAGSSHRNGLAESAGALCSFHVASFPYYDGPVLVPHLHEGLEFDLGIERREAGGPDAIRVLWGKDHLGYVPGEFSEHLLQHMAEGNELCCRSVRVDPSAELEKVLEVEVIRV